MIPHRMLPGFHFTKRFAISLRNQGLPEFVYGPPSTKYEPVRYWPVTASCLAFKLDRFPSFFIGHFPKRSVVPPRSPPSGRLATTSKNACLRTVTSRLLVIRSVRAPFALPCGPRHYFAFVSAVRIPSISLCPFELPQGPSGDSGTSIQTTRGGSKPFSAASWIIRIGMPRLLLGGCEKAQR